MATDTAKAKKQMRQSNQIVEKPVPVYCLSDVRRADIHWEREEIRMAFLTKLVPSARIGSDVTQSRSEK